MFTRKETEYILTPKGKTVWFVGKKHFFTRYGALRHLAKMELLQELEQELRHQRPPIAYSKQIFHEAFKEKYGKGYCRLEEGPSPFARAVTQRVKEIEERLKNEDNR